MSFARIRALSLDSSCVSALFSGPITTYDVLLRLRFDLRTTSGKFERLERFRTMLLLCRHCTYNADVRVSSKCILQQVSQFRVAVRHVSSDGQHNRTDLHRPIFLRELIDDFSQG